MRKTAITLLLSLSLLFLPSQGGYTMTQGETKPYTVIPTSLWMELTNELKTQENELMQFQNQLDKLKQPSQTLQAELTEAKNLLEKSKLELQNAKTDLTALRSDKAELEISLKKLKESIDRERRIRKRQMWQNRIWFMLLGAGIGIAASK